jgi:hypothetical protein
VPRPDAFDRARGGPFVDAAAYAAIGRAFEVQTERMILEVLFPHGVPPEHVRKALNERSRKRARRRDRRHPIKWAKRTVHDRIHRDCGDW